jgi:ribonuclease T
MCRLHTGSARMSWYRCAPERRFFGASRNEGVLMSDAGSTVAVENAAAGCASAPAGGCGPGSATQSGAPSADVSTSRDRTPSPAAATNGAPAASTAANLAALMSRRFRGFLPVVIDVETGGFHSSTDALLEIAAVLIDIQPDGTLKRGATHSFHVKPFEGARLDPAALAITGIDPFHPLRPALPEKDALGRVFREIRHAIHAYSCRRAILVGHNAAFDLGFLNAAVTRAEVKRNPFHPFSCFDTATLAGAALGQTVLAKALAVAGLKWDPSSAHSASYDAEQTADIFCLICNRLSDSFQDAQHRARAMGWINAAAPAAEPAADEPPSLET